MKALTDKIIDVLNNIKQSVNSMEYEHGIDQAIYRIETLEKEATFEEIARVMMKHLANPEKYHPHHRVVLDSTHAELLEGKQSTGQVLDYITD
jgi:uncharacterized protein (UPF0248 family)